MDGQNIKTPYEARIVPEGMPIDCCNFAVVDWRTGREVCRAWGEDEARDIAAALNLYVNTPPDGAE